MPKTEKSVKVPTACIKEINTFMSPIQVPTEALSKTKMLTEEDEDSELDAQ